jgi:hypothetical protein
LRSLKKMLLGAVTLAVLAAGVVVSPASASVPSQGYQTQKANVPYLAWRGEHVRLGFCAPPDSETGAPVAIPTDAQVTWGATDWSGDPGNGSIPVPFEILGARHFSNGCVYTEFTSEKAGVAFIKLEINNPGTAETGAGESTYVKQFLVAWMQLTTPAVTGGGNVNAGDFNCEVNQAAALSIKRDLTDPDRVCPEGFDPRHLITATVKGIIPLGANFDEWVFPASGVGSLVTPGQLTMPDDWAAWAAVAARSSQPDHLRADWISNWDIHDTIASSEDKHVVSAPPGSQCNLADETNLPGSTDTVDNCMFNGDQFGNTLGGFSTIFGKQSRAGFTVGPFDPLYPYDTMLSDGIVDSGDAPMPAAQIDVDITENSGNPGDISGVGYLYPSYKADVKSRDGLGTNAAHNFDQPFYYQYIPATARPADALGSPYGAVQPTGITGVPGSGFPGFWWTSSDAYQNWQFAWEGSYHPGTDSKCLWYQSVPSGDPTYRPLPYGDSSVTVYTDEHGEADVNYVPGFGFYFDVFGVKNSDGGCDLKDKNPLGTADVTVTARYPYQPVTAADPAAAPVPFVVKSLFAKTLAVYPKGASPEDNNVRIVLAHAQDIDGSPLQYERVCWTGSHVQAIQVFPGGSAGGDIFASFPVAPDTVPVAHIDYDWVSHHSFYNQAGQLCTTTDANGNTAVEVTNSEGETADVMAFWLNEQIWRDIPVNFSVKSGVPGSLADSGPVEHIPTPTTIKAAVGPTGATVGPVVADPGKILKTKVIKSHKVKKTLHKIRTARVVKPFHGKRVLQVRVNGKAGMVGLRITIKLGSTKHTYTRFVPANRKVAVKNLPIPVKTAKVTVSLLGI